jgi:hypothetical protein
MKPFLLRFGIAKVPFEVRKHMKRISFVRAFLDPYFEKGDSLIDRNEALAEVFDFLFERKQACESNGKIIWRILHHYHYQIRNNPDGTIVSSLACGDLFTSLLRSGLF